VIPANNLFNNDATLVAQRSEDFKILLGVLKATGLKPLSRVCWR
jgi:hypothetical protein